MLGRSHAQVAAASWAGALVLASGYGVRVNGTGVVMSTCAAVAAGLFPDIDEPGSTAARNIGLLGKLMAKVVRKACNGHRGLTHTLGAVGAAAGAMFVAQQHPVTLGIAVGLLVGTALDVWRRVPEGVEWIAALFAAAGSGTLAGQFPIWLLPLAVGWGWHCHLLCDMCTMQPIPYRWPLNDQAERNAWGLFRAGSVAETWTVRGIWLVLGALVVVHAKR